MGNKYLSVSLVFLMVAFLQLAGNTCCIAFTTSAMADTTKKVLYLKDNRPNRPQFHSSDIINKDFASFMMKISAVKASSSLTKSTSANTEKSSILVADPQKSLDNVKIYPNPVSTQINLSYTLNKENTVTVKILDVLGNEVATLMSQKVGAGEQINSFNLTSKLNSGLYFVRIVSGSESIIKRISVL